ncbi:MAG: hypothetical protein E6Q97_04425 [Desulfurellales bacterium]|nr:MAG: hypothetical protein E6Q97_04425 [Desulfurellales bacterium]
MSREPTDRQLEVVQHIYESIRLRGYPPTRRELCEKLGLRSTNAVADLLRAAQKKGLLVLDTKTARGISLTPFALTQIRATP